MRAILHIEENIDSDDDYSKFLNKVIAATTNIAAKSGEVTPERAVICTMVEAQNIAFMYCKANVSDQQVAVAQCKELLDHCSRSFVAHLIKKGKEHGKNTN